MRKPSTLRRIFFSSCVIITLLMVAFSSYGQQYKAPFGKGLDGALGQLAVDSSREVYDTVFINKSGFPATDSLDISNFITLSVNEFPTVIPPDSFKLDVEVRLYYLTKDSLYDSLGSKILSIEYNKARAYNGKAIFHFKDAPLVKMKVIGITYNYAALANILPHVKLQNDMVIKRIFALDCGTEAVKTVTLEDANINSTGELLVTWSALDAALEYDFEWTFVDQTALDAGWYNTGGILDPEKIFRNNATRVTVYGFSYKIPLLYEGDGKLFARVRAAHVDKTGERKTTHWSSDYIAEGGLGQYSFAGHERKLNWQASTSFAEDGKRKSVLQYFDGSLRNRQTVTKDNTTDSTLTAETFYDKQGRAVVQVLPSPTLSSIIKYTPLFNKAPGGIEYDKEQYDADNSAYCSTSASGMDSSAGTSRYYSYNNPNKLERHNQFLPQAKGYPFTEVKYTQDNTGRVFAQGGVGPTFQLNSGHETKYYYGTAEQSDLDALFGTEAGYASHYQKNVVRDANGQYSVSYVDMHGRTVATALAGESPANMQKLDSYNTITRTDSLVNSKNNLVKDNSIVSVKSLLVTKAGTHKFNYKLAADSLTLLDKNGEPVCYSCLYDLTITITDDCNNQSTALNGKPYVVRDSNMRVTPPIYDTTCTGTVKDFNISFNLTLSEGNYTITKVLTLRQDARDWYRDSLYAPHNTVKTKQDIIKDQLAILRAQRAGNCEQVAEPWYPYLQYRDRMLVDLTPLVGQYAEYILPPKVYTLPSIFQNYQGSNTSVYQHYTGQTMPPDQFIMNFQPEWAEQMLPAHPEYDKLKFYEDLKSSYHWDANFEATDTYAQALAKGYLNPTNYASSPASAFGNGNDSVFYNTPSGLSKATLEGSILNYTKDKDNNNLSLWAMASIAGHCDLSNKACADGFRTTPSTLFGSSMCDGEKDMAWRYFRNEYLRLKRDWITAFVNSKKEIKLLNGATPVFPTGGTMSQLALQGDLVGNDRAKAEKAAADSMTASAYRNCREYTKQWWQQLASCNYTVEDSLKLMPRLVEICKLGTGYDRPFGSSSIAPTESYPFRSFDELITHYNDSVGISNDAACNAFLIDAPGPYNKPLALVNMPTYSRPDSCTCDKITGLYNQYQAAPAGYTNFSDYVQQKLHTTITQNALDSLRNLCDGTITCRFIPNMIMIPPALQCATGYDVCVDCNQVNTVYNAFKNSYPGIIPAYADTSLQQRQNNELFKKYMNNKLSFSKSTLEYLQFMDSCGVTLANSCDSLQSLVVNYKSIDPTCSTAEFTTYFNQQKGTAYTFNQISSIFLNVCGNYPEVCSSLENLSRATLLNDLLIYNSLYNPNRATFRAARYDSNQDVTDNRLLFKGGALSFPQDILNGNSNWYNLLEVRRSRAICNGSFYDVEYRFRFPINDKNGCCFYMTGFNNSAVFGLKPTGIYLEAFSNELGYNYGIHHDGADTSLFKTILAENDLNKLYTWNTVKIRTYNKAYAIYFNDKFLIDIPRDSTLPLVDNMLQQFVFIGTEIDIDWIKIKKDSTVAYFEDFNDPYNPSNVAASALCTNTADCLTSFANYFNGQHGTTYNFAQLDSLYANQGLLLQVCGIEMSALNCNDLTNLENEYKQQYITPSSGYVDLDMRTFAGNKTPDEGPKGVFDVKGKLIANTIDSTPTAIKQSYVKIWNSSIDNRAIGTLSLLQSGKFRLTLNAGKQAPGEGIIGQRYYQFEVNTNDTLQSLYTTLGSYIDFGDSTFAYINDSLRTPLTIVSKDDTTQLYFGTKKYWGECYVPITRCFVDHFYPQTINPVNYTVTLYHTDYKGVVGFFDYFKFPRPSQFKNLRGYFPQHLIEVEFNGTKDSTINTTKLIKNFDQINTIQNVEFDSNGPNTPFLYNNFSSFARNHDLRRLVFNTSLGSSPASDSLLGKHLYEPFPNINLNFPNLRFLFFQSLGARSGDVTGFNYELPKLNFLSTTWQDFYPAGFIDSFYNQLVRVNTTVSDGRVSYGYPSSGFYLPSSASTSARNSLLSRNWHLIDGVSSDWTPPPMWGDIINTDTLPLYSSFTDFINGKLGTNFNRQQIDSLYLARCGHKPDCCSVPVATLPTNKFLCGKNESSSQELTIDDVYDPPCSDSTILAYNFATERYSVYKDSLDQSFNKKYNEKCFAAASIESFTVEHDISEYHYTLYYYDQAGNLVKTIAPAGVQPITDGTRLAQMGEKRRLGQTDIPSHAMPTVYRYNSLNQVVTQKTPDAGKSTNWYDRLGRLAVSQNAKQLLESKYSYTLYDPLGRIVEVGQKYQTTAMTNTLSRNASSLDSWVYYNNGSNQYPAEMVTQTIYDAASPDADACVEALRFTQKSYTMRNRVSYTRYYEKPSYYYDATTARYYISPATFATGIDYSYDIHGNVDTMRNLYGTGAVFNIMNKHGYNGCKTIAYTYDLISGKVNEVHYNPGQMDEFYHRYAYDAENRLVEVYTTNYKAFIGVAGLEEREAMYTYYQHGPLARTVFGQLQVTGLDYTYTLQGWLKGINSTGVTTAIDPARDAFVGSVNSKVAQDYYGLTLNYYPGDYQHINYNRAIPHPEPNAYLPAGESNPLYNGNINSMAMNIPLRWIYVLYNYKYDQLNRLVSMNPYRGFTASGLVNNWSAISALDTYKERYSYDANGNIQKLMRNGNLTVNPLMDNLTYVYKPGTNQLDHVRDTTGAGVTAHSNNYGSDVDIKDQSAGNYNYDAIGNMVYDRFSSVDSIKWNVYGKMQTLYKGVGVGSNVRRMHFYYDPSGEKVGKVTLYTANSTNASDTYTWYVRDAQGNVLAVYQIYGSNITTSPLNLLEQFIYGSSRIGTITRNLNMDGSRPDITEANYTHLGKGNLITFTRGNKLFEIANHLGTVNMTVTDQHLPVLGSGSQVLFTPKMASAEDFTPFGMRLQGRIWDGGGGAYRFKFNGKERIYEINGRYNQYDYGMRIYDDRLGRFLSVDPLTYSYPWYTPYQFAGNNPIENIDLDGLEENSQSTYVYMRVPILANKPKSTADNSTKAMNLGTFRMPKASYNEAPWLSLNPFGQTKSNTFGWNVQVSAWNQGVESVEFGYDYLTKKEYRKEFQHVVNKAMWKGLKWLTTTDNDQKLQDAADYVTDVNNWEDGVASVLGGRALSNGVNNIVKNAVRGMGTSSPLNTKCFVAGTKILTKVGLLNIEDIKIGDSVWAFNEMLSQSQLGYVTDTFSSKVDQLVKLEIEDVSIWTTPNHPFNVNFKWIPANRLQRGDSLKLYSGKTSVVSKVTLVDTSVQVFNFTVSRLHNYYVSSLGILVHNDCLTAAQKVAAKAASKHAALFECIQCSEAVAGALKREGLTGELIELSTGSSKRGFIWSDKAGGNISQNGIHRGVLVDGKVFDNLNPNGVTYKDWINDLHSATGLKERRTLIK